MLSSILPTKALSQVIFIHDYIQLVFQDDSFTINNTIELNVNGKVFHQGQLGFCDSLVALIGAPLLSATSKPTLTLTFDGGAVLIVTQFGESPEAWQYCNLNKSAIVERNA